MISLDDREWRQFKIKNIATLKSSKQYPKRFRKNNHDNVVPYINRTRTNNGITDYITIDKNTPKSVYSNVIGVNNSGSTGCSFYHPYTAYFDGDVEVLSFKHLNWCIGLFICTCIYQQRNKFNYGYELVGKRLKELMINLPINSQGRPDWQFMADYMKQVRSEIPSSYVHNHVSHPKYLLDDRQWKQFKIKRLFHVVRGKRIPKRSRHQGKIPFIGASTTNNGVTDNINRNGVKAGYHRNVIGVNYNGAPCYAFYHQYLAYFCDDVITLSKKKLTAPEALFITTCIRQQRAQFTYGFKLKEDRLKNLKIELPVTSTGHPDWKFMTDYMMSMLR